MPAWAPVDKPDEPDGGDCVALLPLMRDVATGVLFASDEAAVVANLARSDSAHITETGQSYADQKSVTAVMSPGRTTEVSVVTLVMQTRLPALPPHGYVGTAHSLEQKIVSLWYTACFAIA